jgi:Flp pilus assembly CpaF family ATPase
MSKGWSERRLALRRRAPAGRVRVQAVLPPLAEGTHVSLRVPHRRHLSLRDLVRLQVHPAELAEGA